MTERRWSVQPARSGRMALVRPDGTWVESRFHPEKDAQRRVDDAKLGDGDSVILIGMGAGELPRAILARIGARGILTIAEPEPDAIRAALQAHLGQACLGQTSPGEASMAEPKCGDLIFDPRTRMIVMAGVELPAACREPECSGRFTLCETPRDFYIALANVNPGARCLSHPGLTLPDGFEALGTFIEDFEIRRRSSHRFAEEFERNTERNAERFASAIPVSTLDGVLKGSDVIVAGGGPSLENIARIVGNGANWIATGTALRPLEKYGIAPHLAVITDPQSSVGRQLTLLESGSLCPVVVFPSTSHEVILNAPQIIAAYAEGSASPVTGARATIPADCLTAGGTVTTTALGMAIRIGARRIFLAGVDLAELPSRSHTRGTANEAGALVGMDRFRSVEQTGRPGSQGRIEATSVAGHRVLTRRNLQLYARAIEALIARASDAEFIQLSPWALPLRGARHADVSEFHFSRMEFPAL